MLIKINTPPTFSLFTTGSASSVNSYTVSKNGGSPSAGASSVFNPGLGAVGVTLTAGEVDTLGDLLVIFYDVSSNPLAAVNHQVVSFDPADGASLGLTKLAAIVPDPWVVALPGGYTAGQAGYILGHVGGGVDPWSVVVPGAYPAGQAGYVLGHMALAVAASVLSTPNSVDVGLTLVQAIKLMTAVLCGVSSVAGFTVTFNDTTDTISRVVATLDGTGQRTGVVYNTA